MREAGIEPTPHTWTMLAKAYAIQGDAESAMQVRVAVVVGGNVSVNRLEGT